MPTVKGSGLCGALACGPHEILGGMDGRRRDSPTNAPEKVQNTTRKRDGTPVYRMSHW